MWWDTAWGQWTGWHGHPLRVWHLSGEGEDIGGQADIGLIVLGRRTGKPWMGKEPRWRLRKVSEASVSVCHRWGEWGQETAGFHRSLEIQGDAGGLNAGGMTYSDLHSRNITLAALGTVESIGRQELKQWGYYITIYLDERDGGLHLVLRTIEIEIWRHFEHACEMKMTWQAHWLGMKVRKMESKMTSRC